jgi:hypothetical protein
MLFTANRLPKDAKGVVIRSRLSDSTDREKVYPQSGRDITVSFGMTVPQVSHSQFRTGIDVFEQAAVDMLLLRGK